MNIRLLTSVLLFLSVAAGCRKDKSFDPPDTNKDTGIRRIWAVDDGEKIKRDDITNALATDINNAVWHDSSINIFGARNEIVAFQLIIQAEKKGAGKVNVVVSDLTNGTTVIPGSAQGPADPFDYRDRYVELLQNIILKSQAEPLRFGSILPVQHHQPIIPDGSPIVLFLSLLRQVKAELPFQ
ncbi:MAG: hypothetical protein IPJ37_13540 [Bacteroidales bacterium]|nr:hypothetical protein [Bacteroidales bacterium]